jgi:uncharacterized membrane protein
MQTPQPPDTHLPQKAPLESTEPCVGLTQQRPNGAPSDHEIELSVAGMLRFGVTLAAILVAIGGVLLLRHPYSPAQDLRHFDATGVTYESLQAVYRSVLQMRPTAIIQAGLIVLIATPVARVVFCVIGFARQRDRLYVGISLIVLVVLLYSFLKGGH